MRPKSCVKGETSSRKPQFAQQTLASYDRQHRADRAEVEIANEAKIQFLAGVCHELRPPLNAILGFSEMIKHQIYGPINHQQYEGYVEDIHSTGN